MSLAPDGYSNFIISVEATDYNSVGQYTPFIEVQLVDWPEVQMSTAPFDVVIEACFLSNSRWSNGQLTRSLDYTIGSGNRINRLFFDVNDNHCETEVQVSLAGENHDRSIITKING